MRRFATYLLLVLALCSSGCRGRKSVPSAAPVPYPVADADTPVSALYASLADGWQQWEDVYMPVNLTMEMPAAMSIGGRATLIRDSLVHISLRAMGMEVGVVHADRDSLFVVDKYHKYYIAEDIAKLGKRYGISLAEMQDLLLGRLFIPGTGTAAVTDSCRFDMERIGGMYVLNPHDTTAGLSWQYSAWATDPSVIKALQLTPDTGMDGYPAAVLCTYSGVKPQPAGMTASDIIITARTANLDIKAALQWQLGDARWDTGREVRFTSPSSDSRYRRIDLSLLLSQPL